MCFQRKHLLAAWTLEARRRAEATGVLGGGVELASNVELGSGIQKEGWGQHRHRGAKDGWAAREGHQCAHRGRGDRCRRGRGADDTLKP